MGFSIPLTEIRVTWVIFSGPGAGSAVLALVSSIMIGKTKMSTKGGGMLQADSKILLVDDSGPAASNAAL
jgi:hypothetical protein